MKLFKIDDLKMNKVQPKGRTATEAKLRELALSIKEHGILAAPLVTEDGIVIDGHRRIAVWQALGHATIYCKVVETANEQAMFAQVNAPVQKLTSADYFYTWAVADDRDAQLRALGNRATWIKKFIKVFGQDTAIAYGKTGKVSPTVVGKIQPIQRAISLYEDAPKAITIGHWLIKHRSAVVAQFIIKDGTAKQVRALARAIRQNKPIELKR